MKRIIAGLLGWLMVTLACQPAQPLPAMPIPTATLIPSPTPIPLPPALTPTIVKPTPINTRVVQATFTPKPAATATSQLPPTATHTLVPSSHVRLTATPIFTQTDGTTVNWADAEGEPTIISGQDEGYFVWTNGDQVHLRAATQSGMYLFSGQAMGNGTMAGIEPSGPQVKLTVEDNNRMAFQWATAGGPDGLDFTFTGATLVLDLRIDGKPELSPNLVFVGPDKLQVANGLPLQLKRK
jgi:hypothetical protein